jgi:prepilin-type N-terminal cleavage/methylation domain-containing protein
MKISRQRNAGFTLIEVAVASAIAALLFAGIFGGYTVIGRRVQFAAYNLAGNSCAMKQMEQILDSQWVPSSGITNLFTNYPNNIASNYLYLPSAQGSFTPCTNYITITAASANPPYAMVRVDCVWTFPQTGLFTNTVAVLRAPNL